MTVIDAVGMSVITRLPVGRQPVALLWNPDGNRIYCANRGGSSVTVIDGALNSVVATIDVGSDPEVLCLNSTNNKIYCALILVDSLAIIDGASNSVTRRLAIGQGPTALAWNATDNKVYCANRFDGVLAVERRQRFDYRPYRGRNLPGGARLEPDRL